MHSNKKFEHDAMFSEFPFKECVINSGRGSSYVPVDITFPVLLDLNEDGTSIDWDQFASLLDEFLTWCNRQPARFGLGVLTYKAADPSSYYDWELENDFDE